MRSATLCVSCGHSLAIFINETAATEVHEIMEMHAKTTEDKLLQSLTAHKSSKKSVSYTHVLWILLTTMHACISGKRDVHDSLELARSERLLYID